MWNTFSRGAHNTCDARGASVILCTSWQCNTGKNLGLSSITPMLAMLRWRQHHILWIGLYIVSILPECVCLIDINHEKFQACSVSHHEVVRSITWTFASKLCGKDMFLCKVKPYLTSLQNWFAYCWATLVHSATAVYCLLAGGKHHKLWMEQSSLESTHQFLCTLKESVFIYVKIVGKFLQ